MYIIRRVDQSSIYMYTYYINSNFLYYNIFQKYPTLQVSNMEQKYMYKEEEESKIIA